MQAMSLGTQDNQIQGDDMSKALYKVYDPDNNAICFESLSALRKFFDLSAEETSKCFYKGIHTVAFGVTVITY